MTQIQNKVDQSAEFYNQSFLSFDFKLAEFGFDTLKSYFKGEIALELGPASGYMTGLLAKEFKTLHIVEGSKVLLDQIPEYENVKKHCSLFEEFKTDIKFDTIVMSHVLEHISEPVSVLKQIREWLKDDGVFLVAVPNAKSLHRTVAVEMGLLSDEHQLNQRDHDLGHYRVYDLPMLRSHLEEASFIIKKMGGYFLKPLTNSQIDKHWDDAMIQGFYEAGKKFPEICAEIFAVVKK
ncbi:MAG TPA: class I SAM-dependent methyltransferase [Cytophagaceae bacterium]|jgi:2-polyprenyl-3-methyl-5-hydroxy-6-metoxy-1,4-benzoquinol methylase